jgi:hypothetical protein
MWFDAWRHNGTSDAGLVTRVPVPAENIKAADVQVYYCAACHSERELASQMRLRHRVVMNDPSDF